jgi:hypothetical protein
VRWYCEEACSSSFFLIGVVLLRGPKMTLEVQSLCQTFGPIHETMQILQYQGKGSHLNTIERYFIYKEFSKNNEFNITPNKIFDALLKPR